EHINLEKAMCSVGTLGGGNHFIEIDKDTDGILHLTIHSGSRRLGKEVTEYYLHLGQKELKSRKVSAPWPLIWLDGQLLMDFLHDVF
ncbi:MAG: RtcB family protein, partial [Lachnospiraceae bacterium]|nr:RtcB family protein [Lachnospiraceae bacterium]